MNAEYRAFPAPENSDTDGMTYREWLIGMALSGFCADSECKDPACMAIQIADEVMAELKKE